MKQQHSGQMIKPCQECGDIICKNVINAKCLGTLNDFEKRWVEKLKNKKGFCPLCKADLPQ